jgi:hypothetical protein
MPVQVFKTLQSVSPSRHWWGTLQKEKYPNRFSLAVFRLFSEILHCGPPNAVNVNNLHMHWAWYCTSSYKGADPSQVWGR